METTAKFRPNIEVAADAEDLAQRTVRFFITTAREALASRERFYAALSGGQTPQRTFELLGASPEAGALPWSRIQMFWVDERYVPPDSPYSNYRLAADTFLSKVPIPPDNIHRIPTEYDDIHEAAEVYKAMIQDAFGVASGEMPRFDLMVLGMGPDGHTGSLLPNSYAPFDVDALVSVVYALGDTLCRITLTHPVLQAARRLAVLVSGSEKAQVLNDVLTGEPDEVRYPIHVLWPVLDKIVWLVDRDAAEALIS
jgi:6-phosphogluconolactonase